MLSINDYRTILRMGGNSVSEIKKTQSIRNINTVFTSTTEYKKAYILTKDGWKFEDIKFYKHTDQAITSDASDYYIEFRPKVHYPIGSYIIIPDDSGPMINLSSIELVNPFNQPIDQRTQWWMIVNRNKEEYSKYNILQCNWNFKWIWNNSIQQVFGCVRDASSYTSGKWTDEYSSTFDELTTAWIPNTHYIYGDSMQNLGVCDTRTIMHDQRFIITYNMIDPKVYAVTKIKDVVPAGVIKLSIKQDTFNEKADNVEEMVCNYYSQTGVSNVKEFPERYMDYTKSVNIIKYDKNESGELVPIRLTSEIVEDVILGVPNYFGIESDNSKYDLLWTLEVIDEDNKYTQKQKERIIQLMRITSFSDTIVSIKPGKAKELIGMKFKLVLNEANNDCNASCILEVIDKK